MTTIAYDGKRLAVDGAAVSGSILQHCLKIRRFSRSEISRDVEVYMGLPDCKKDDDFIWGMCGSFDELLKAYDWIKTGISPEDRPKLDESVADYGLLVHRQSGRVFCVLPTLRLLEVSYPTAAGSGSRYAAGCLAAGASAERTVQLTIENTTLAGLGVVVYDLESNVISSTNIKLQELVESSEINL